jgi:hypothetical protein
MPILYSTSVSFTMTLAALAADAARESDSIDNSTAKFDDYMIGLDIAANAAGTLADQQAVYIYLAGSIEGTTFTEPATGADSAIVVATNTNLTLAKILNAHAAGTTYSINIPSVSSCFGGVIPKKFSVIIDNQTNAALNGTEANHAKWWTGVTYTS